MTNQVQKTSRILFTDKEHSWRIEKITFDFSGVTDPLPLERVVYSDPHEWSWLEMDEVLERTKDFEYQSPNQNKYFYEIVETFRNMKTIHDMITIYQGKGSGIGSLQINFLNEVRAIELLTMYIEYANHLHKLIGVNDKIEISDRLIIKICREAVPTLFKMPNNERSYDDSKSVIIQLSPYENNDKVLKEKSTHKKCTRPLNKVKQFLENPEAVW